MNVFSPPSLYSKTSYSTDRPSHLDQLPRSAPPSSLTRNRRLWPVGWSGIVSASAQVGQEAGALPIDQQFGFEPGANLVVELSGQLIHVGLGLFVTTEHGSDGRADGAHRRASIGQRRRPRRKPADLGRHGIEPSALQ